MKLDSRPWKIINSISTVLPTNINQIPSQGQNQDIGIVGPLWEKNLRGAIAKNGLRF